MNRINVTSFLIIIFSDSLFGHGMNSLGPNGGFIKMPGAYHTELVEEKESMKVYLLDVSFKNPVTDQSTVKIKYKGEVEIEFNCQVKKDYFICNKPKDDLKKFNEIHLYTQRYSNKLEKPKVLKSIYDLPLKLKN